MLISLPTGKTLYIAAYEFLFVLKDEDVDMFYQSCIADDLGDFIETPFFHTSLENREEAVKPVDFEDLLEE